MRGSKPCPPGCTCGRHLYYGNGGRGKCVPGCTCKRHSAPGRPPTPAIDRFFDKVWPHGGHWLWIGALDGGGYGLFYPGGLEERHLVKAHRWAFKRWVGEYPEGMETDHLCRVRNCVNPGHLEAVTKKENWARSRPYRVMLRGRDGRFVCHTVK